MQKIHTIGVAGAGTMGSAIAQKFAQEGFEVVLADRQKALAEKGMQNIRASLSEGVERKALSGEEAEGALARITATADLNDLAACDLVVEAVFEDLGVKQDLFRTLGGILRPDAILATNTSSFTVSELADSVSNPERFIGLHYFYHAAKNRLVEIVPCRLTSDATVRAVRRLCVQSGKDPITVADSRGFAVNRFFVPWLNEAVRLLAEGEAGIDEIEAVCRKTFGIGMGPFALMNATGMPVALHAQRSLETFGPFYRVSELLEKQVRAGDPWIIEGGVKEPSDKKRAALIRERMLGAVFFVCTQILDEGLCTAAALNRGARIGLRWKKGPVELMRESGEAQVKRLVLAAAKRYDMKQPEAIGSSHWKMQYVTLEKTGSRAVITMDRPEDLNALSEETVSQLDKCFSAADLDPEVDTVFITGTGKAFAAGADIGFFVENMKAHSVENIVRFTRSGQDLFDRIDRSPKKVVALVNGMALGGGLELALCADIIIAVPQAVFSFPETGIGIYPGLGGTQRCAQRLGKGLAKYLILTGRMLKSEEARQIGLIDEVIPPDELPDIPAGGRALPVSFPMPLEGRWKALAELYLGNSYRRILTGPCRCQSLDEDELAGLRKAMKRKAPLAMEIAEKLITEARGPASELEDLAGIFSTQDALTGLTSIGSSPEYVGK